MLLPELILWWYGPGWRDQVAVFVDRLAAVVDRYSLELLARTIFKPFRQIDAYKIRGSFDAMLRAWLDRLVSRLIGALVRLVMLVFGLVVCVLHVSVGLIWLIVWPILPLLPVIGLILAGGNWLPWEAWRV